MKTPTRWALPIELILLCAEHLGPVTLVSLLHAEPQLTRLLTSKHTTPWPNPPETTKRNRRNRIDEGTKGTTILHVLAERGELELMKLLPLNGTSTSIDLDCTDSKGWTPLSSASRAGQEEVVGWLLAQTNVKVNVQDVNGWAPLHHAAANGHVAVVNRLFAERDDVELEIQTRNRETPLFLAAQHGKEEALKALLEIERDAEGEYKGVNTTDDVGQTPLAVAVENAHEAVVKLLLEQDGIDADEGGDCDVLTPLCWAATCGHEGVARLLLGHPDVCVNTGSCLRDDWGVTPLIYAARAGHLEVMRVLLEQDDIDVDVRDQDRRTALSYAMRNRHEEMVKLLVERGASTAGLSS